MLQRRAIALTLFTLVLLIGPAGKAQPAAPVVPDALNPVDVGSVQLGGWLGKRVAVNEKNRLLEVDLEPLLAGYRKRPGSHPWIGEHIGKWLHAATLAWVNTKDPALKAKLDKAVTDLIACQEPDGYLGTYLPDKRFGLYEGNDWDVWSHKYCLIGLLTYYRYTNNRAALDTCRKVGDLLINTFGPGKKSIISAGTHVGMAATSVLEPIVLLYRASNDSRYLDFAKYIVAAYNEPNGPHVLATLTATGKVNQTANGKAYEMLSNLVGLCELYRATGDKQYLIPAVRGWDDVSANQLYITGTASYGEHFHKDHDLPNVPVASIGETCVTVTWIQLTEQLLRITGRPKYGDALEQSYYNHLAAAQRPDGKEWCYYTALEGTKPYGPGINCCVSSGPRGMAIIPRTAYYTRKGANNSDTLFVNLLESSRAEMTIGGQKVTVIQESAFPQEGRSRLRFVLSKPATFGVNVRGASWALPMTISAGTAKNARTEADWLVLRPRQWKNGDVVDIRFNLSAGFVMGNNTNWGNMALRYGPFVLACDAANTPWLSEDAAPTFGPDAVRKLQLPPANERPGARTTVVDYDGKSQDIRLVPFAEAGTTGKPYFVWLGTPGRIGSGIRSARSRQGNRAGSIVDESLQTLVVTFDGTRQDEDWYSVTYSQPRTIQAIRYAHGWTFHDGGWFDASAGKPRIEIRRTVNGPWESVGTLSDYPNTTATDPKDLTTGQIYTLRLPQPLTVAGIRIVGKPATGDDSSQAFSSCAELQGIEEVKAVQ